MWTTVNQEKKVDYDSDPETNVWQRMLFYFVGILPIEDQL